MDGGNGDVSRVRDRFGRQAQGGHERRREFAEVEQREVLQGLQTRARGLVEDEPGDKKSNRSRRVCHHSLVICWWPARIRSLLGQAVR